jgi:hypothetical protein
VTDLSTLAWRRSTWCAGANCVEVATAGGSVALRDSNAIDGAVLFLAPADWEAFLNGAKAGEFDFAAKD